MSFWGDVDKDDQKTKSAHFVGNFDETTMTVGDSMQSKEASVVIRGNARKQTRSLFLEGPPNALDYETERSQNRVTRSLGFYENGCNFSLSTTDDDNLGSYGAMFDIRTKNSAIVLHALEFYTFVESKVTYDIYDRNTTFIGADTLSDWNRLERGTTDGLGRGKNTPVTFPPVWIPPHTTRGFYITLTRPDLRYKNPTGEVPTVNVGDIYAENDDLMFLAGASVGTYPISDKLFSPRIWSGNIVYEVDRTCPSVEPSMGPSIFPSEAPTSLASDTPSQTLVASSAPTRSPVEAIDDGCHSDLVTTLDDNLGSYGILFDIQTKNATISLEALEYFTNVIKSITCEIYTRPSSFIGAFSPSAWNLVAKVTENGKGPGVGSILPIEPIMIPPNSTQGMYITMTTPDLRYQNPTNDFPDLKLGEIFSENDDVAYRSGMSVGSYPMQNSFFSPRIWRGKVHYIVDRPCPSTEPSVGPSSSPSIVASFLPSDSPSIVASIEPSHSPSIGPSHSPSIGPSHSPSIGPSHSPSIGPSHSPSIGPSHSPSIGPSHSPSIGPSHSPSIGPSHSPSIGPSHSPSFVPSDARSMEPTVWHSFEPSFSPSDAPSIFHSFMPSDVPSVFHSFMPSDVPSVFHSFMPSDTPSFTPTIEPSITPSVAPSETPSIRASFEPSESPSISPSLAPSEEPTVASSFIPSDGPSIDFSMFPSEEPSTESLLTLSEKPSISELETSSEKPSGLHSEVPSSLPSLASSEPTTALLSFMPSIAGSDVWQCPRDGTIKTSLEGGTGAFGHMFTVTSHDPLYITSMNLHIGTTEHVEVEVFTKQGDYKGSETDKNAWHEVAKLHKKGQGLGKETEIPSDDFETVYMEKGSTQAFYIRLSEGELRYSRSTVKRGDPITSRLHLSINAGAGLATKKFGGSLHEPRAFNGVIHFRYEDDCTPRITTDCTFTYFLRHANNLGKDTVLHSARDSVRRALKDLISHDVLLQAYVDSFSFDLDNVVAVESDPKTLTRTCTTSDSSELCTPADVKATVSHKETLHSGEVEFTLLQLKDAITRGLNSVAGLSAEYAGDEPVTTDIDLVLNGLPARGLSKEEKAYFQDVTLDYLKSHLTEEKVNVLDVEVDSRRRSRRHHRHLQEGEGEEGLDLSTVIVGEYRPPPEIDYGAAVGDSLNTEDFVNDLKKPRHDQPGGSLFENVTGIQVDRKGAEPEPSSDGSSMVFIAVGLLVAALAVAGGVFFWLRRGKARKGASVRLTDNVGGTLKKKKLFGIFGGGSRRYVDATGSSQKQPYYADDVFGDYGDVGNYQDDGNRNQNFEGGRLLPSKKKLRKSKRNDEDASHLSAPEDFSVQSITRSLAEEQPSALLGPYTGRDSNSEEESFGPGDEFELFDVPEEEESLMGASYSEMYSGKKQGYGP